ncbi:hypothetical protein C9426_12695 [Serratia sp. S1B]|nr:hypothetical protein C9426_12695 [Serratia sp. S1B]
MEWLVMIYGVMVISSGCRVGDLPLWFLFLFVVLFPLSVFLYVSLKAIGTAMSVTGLYYWLWPLLFMAIAYYCLWSLLTIRRQARRKGVIGNRRRITPKQMKTGTETYQYHSRVSVTVFDSYRCVSAIWIRAIVVGVGLQTVSTPVFFYGFALSMY